MFPSIQILSVEVFGRTAHFRNENIVVSNHKWCLIYLCRHDGYSGAAGAPRTKKSVNTCCRLVFLRRSHHQDDPSQLLPASEIVVISMAGVQSSQPLASHKECVPFRAH